MSSSRDRQDDDVRGLQLADPRNTWPEVGDQPFRSDGKYGELADTGARRNDGFWIRAIGFKRAGDLLAEHCLQTGSDRDFLSFPMVFSYRHFLELSLKELAFMVFRARGDRAMRPYGHGLIGNWDMIRDFALDGPSSDTEAFEIVDGVIAEFERVDPGSFAFRYGTGRRGELLIPDDLATINIRNLMDVMNRTEGLFDGLDGWLDALEGPGS